MADGRFFFILIVLHIVQFSCNSKKAEKKLLNLPLFTRSVTRLKKASQEDIAAVVGPSLAAKLVAALETEMESR